MTTETKYLTCAETAKLVRVQLHKAFPGIKFSVHSKTYSMGASISISWVSGPTTKEVDNVVGGFEGASFDGMNDLQSNQDSWLLPNGEAQLAYRPESWGGSVPGFVSDAPHPNARLVSFGSDYIHTNRSYCKTYQEEDKLYEQIGQDMCKLQRVTYVGRNTTGLYSSGDTERINQYVYRLLHQTSFKPSETYAGVRYQTDEERESDHYANQPMRIIKRLLA